SGETMATSVIHVRLVPSLNAGDAATAKAMIERDNANIKARTFISSSPVFNTNGAPALCLRSYCGRFTSRANTGMALEKFHTTGCVEFVRPAQRSLRRRRLQVDRRH